MPTFSEVVREYFPNADDEEVSFILWEKTGYPHFFMEGEKSLREQLSRWKEARENGFDTCDRCGEMFLPEKLGESCPACRAPREESEL